MGNNNQMNSNGAGKEASMEASQEMHDEPKDARGVDGERKGILEEDETKINESTKDVKDDRRGDVLLPDYETGVQKLLQSPPPPLAPVVRWERFLPVRSLNILLVENDDSTRQLVSALLRNCSYEVTAASDCLQAWRILEDFTNRVDLILTEVNIPGLSGIGLLCKIMSHRTCKNIPVIMMSSNDSVGIVFKCLSKGAVDFLVKPIRKNELKNLWQHVWRRCHSSSGSGSESGIQHQKSTKSKSPDDSDDNTDSNDEDVNGGFGQNLRDGSDNVSGTQSSWTKHAVEDDSPQHMSLSDPWADPYDSTCAQVIHSKHDMPNFSDKERQEQMEVADKNSLEKDLEMKAPRDPDREHIPYPTEKASSVTGASMERLPECNPKIEINENVPGRESSNASSGPITEVADLIDGIADSSEAHLASRVAETPDGFSKISKCKDKAKEDSKELPALELSLKRLRSTGDGDDHNTLRHSDLSAFSRYNSPNPQAPRGRGASSNPHDISEEIKSESTYSMLNAIALKQGSNGSTNNNDMGSTTKDAFTKLSARKEKITSTATAKTIYPSTLHHTTHWPAANQPPIQEKVNAVSAQAMVGQARGVQHEIQVQHHHHHHYHHHHHHVHNMQQQQQPLPSSDHDNISLTNTVTVAPQCGSSNMFPGSMEINAMNYSLNGSASGSNHMSNGHNGSSKAVNAGAMNMESDAAVVANGEAGGTNVVDQNRFSQREAALNKFRQKRKERNFGKKVRYQSRKRLAEQRPRVRGQFVRRTAHEHTSREGSS